MSLTEEWKAGKLENERRYYCRLKYCGNTIVTYKGEYLMHDRFDAIKRDDELEILDIVPSYEELQKLKTENEELKSLRKVGCNGEDNLVSRVLQQSPELVKRRLKACKSHRDSTKPLNYDCYTKEPICEVDPELTRFVKEHCSLLAKLDIAVKALEFYANESHFGDTTYGINGENECWHEGNVENGTKAQEALEKIKEIK